MCDLLFHNYDLLEHIIKIVINNEFEIDITYTCIFYLRSLNITSIAKKMKIVTY